LALSIKLCSACTAHPALAARKRKRKKRGQRKKKRTKKRKKRKKTRRKRKKNKKKIMKKKKKKIMMMMKKKKKDTSFGQPTSLLARGRACGSGVARVPVCFALIAVDRVLANHSLRTCLMQCGCAGRNEQDLHRFAGGCQQASKTIDHQFCSCGTYNNVIYIHKYTNMPNVIYIHIQT